MACRLGRPSKAGVIYDETRDQASAESLPGREVPAAIGAPSDLFRIYVRPVDQLSEASLLQAQSVVSTPERRCISGPE
jgi:hypothetical protein